MTPISQWIVTNNDWDRVNVTTQKGSLEQCLSLHNQIMILSMQNTSKRKKGEEVKMSSRMTYTKMNIS